MQSLHLFLPDRNLNKQHYYFIPYHRVARMSLEYSEDQIVNSLEIIGSMRWKNPLEGRNKREKISIYLLLLVLLTIAFSIRFVNSISVFLLIAVPLIGRDSRIYVRNAFRNPLFLACLGIALTQLAGIFYTSHSADGWTLALRVSGIIFVPFFFSGPPFLSLKSRKFLTRTFGISLVFVSVICLVYASWNYFHSHDSSVFFYHQLLKPFDHHAIHFSFFLFTCVVFWMETDIASAESIGEKNLLIALTVYSCLIMLLLSSKTVISLTIIYFIYYFLSRLFFVRNGMRKVWITGLGLLLMIGFVLGTQNPIKQRFTDLYNGNFSLYRQETFSPEVYFNGMQFRLLLWRFTGEILDSNKAWIFGVSPGDAQDLLNKRMIATNMYLGNGTTDKGYLDYHCHNQFLQTTLETGFVGLIFLIWVFVVYGIWIYREKNRTALIMVLSLLVLSFTESIFKAQFLIVAFTLMPLMALKSSNQRQ